MILCVTYCNFYTDKIDDGVTDMTDTDKAPATLQGRLNRYKPNQAVKLVSELCSQLVGDCDSFHGAIWPGNIRLSSDKKAVLGISSDAPVSQREADEVEFLAPEFFWDGSKSAAADVYSLGLLLYAMCNRGRMPFQPRNKTLTDTDRSAALRRRMKGETVSVTGKLSAELKAVIAKALSYDPEKRFISAAELLAALEETEEAKPAEGEAAAPAPVAEETPVPAEETAPAAEEPAVSIEEAAETLSAEESAAEEQAEILTETPDAVEAIPEPAAEEPASETPTDEVPAAEEETESNPEIRRYTVQKDFEKTVPYRRASSKPSGRRKKRVSPLIPILAILAVGIILVVVLVMALGAVNDPVNNLPESTISPSFTLTPSEIESETDESQSANAEGTEDTAQEESAGTEEEPADEHRGSATVNGMDVEAVYDIVLVIESGAKLRTGPGTSYDVADSLPKNTELVRTGTVENWSQVQYNDGEYYIANTLITESDKLPEEEVEAAPAPAGSENSNGSIGTVVVKSEANIRAGAGTGYDKLGVAKVGTELTVTDVTDDGKWYQVSYNGKTGYINRNMVTVDELEYSATATVTGDVNVRSGPGSEYTKLGVAKTGDKLTVTGVTGTNWYQISYNGKTGYVAGNYISVN